MKHKVYQRDWYFNAGIIGFMRVLCDGEALTTNEIFDYSENYVTFDNKALLSFKKKFVKQAFLSLFRIMPFITKLEYLNKEIKNDKTGKKKPATLVKNLGKTYVAFYDIMKLYFETTDQNSFSESLQAGIKRLQEYTEENLFSHLNSFKKGKEYVQYFVNLKLKGISGITKLNDYIKAIHESKNTPIKDKDLCLFCQKRKASFDFNNSVSNIVGFNNDNANWIWGYRTQNTRLCGLCALIYSCAILSFAYVVKMINSEYCNYLYFINHNTSVERMYKEIEVFKILLRKDTHHTFFEMIKTGISIIQTNRMKKIDENINFIEIADNPILGGQSTKGYNIYNYNIDKYIAGFLKGKIPDKIPKGYYSINKLTVNIDEELLKLTITNQLNYNTLNRYIFYKISKSTTITTMYNIPRITYYILDFISYGGKMDQNKVYKRGFQSGIQLKGLLNKEKKENQINGIVYGLLNCLKIADKEKFLDKYIRLMMAYKMSMGFTKDEMTNKDCFLQFGYSFINGLLAVEKSDEKQEEKV